ncbi:MAG: indolepyruvate ferredoxin oxidoreductase subunit alpha [Bacillota bacterium]|nr:indolepyruvate ferredoxin oxidoreductase subunit alpha [Bacillota bacterium]
MKEIMLGNHAVARGAYEAGVKVASAYPGTPSTEIMEYMATLPCPHVEWAPNEKVAAETAIGSSIAGGRAICAMKHVGLNVAADPLFTAAYTGVNAGLLICVADDPGMHSSQNEQDSRNYARAAKVIMLEPSDSNECYIYAKNAFSLSEKFDLPVILRLSTRVSHSQSLVETGEREEFSKPYEKNPGKYVMMPAMAKRRHPELENILTEVKNYAQDCEFNKIEYHDKKIGIITSGITYQYAKEALGDKASYLKLGMVYPLPEKLISEFSKNVDTLYVAEELDDFFEEYIKSLGIKVIGKEAFTKIGEYSADLIRKVILKEEQKGTAPDEALPARPPVMCAGCPHRGTFYALKSLGLTVCGDIGCYTLGTLEPLASVDSCVCMGASIGLAHGMDKAIENSSKKTVAVLGDSTFIHSGITGLINVVYNKGNTTVIILDNSITGMTGHQDNPLTGKTIKGEPTKQVNLVMLCKAIGVENVRIADPFNIEQFKKVVSEEIEKDEPSVIIAQRPCALLKSVKYEGKMTVTDKCIGCKMCLKIGCPAIHFKDGHALIDKTQCNGCGFCQQICKLKALGKEEA